MGLAPGIFVIGIYVLYVFIAILWDTFIVKLAFLGTFSHGNPQQKEFTSV